ncbi:hypothetical protein CDAR_449151 [Caerostris darwini]|uniref:Uncharacterized protein n=1 Tax=Caerostris darwini TaxID=1538125 RepID=A0AAV4QST3_9ARAC|nr:hypothetical protein CDAR_449151 [Caerostris darwini]
MALIWISSASTGRLKQFSVKNHQNKIWQPNFDTAFLSRLHSHIRHTPRRANLSPLQLEAGKIEELDPDEVTPLSQGGALQGNENPSSEATLLPRNVLTATPSLH